MVDLSKLESELVEGMKKVAECMRIWNKVKIDPTKLAELEVENKRLKHNAYKRKWHAKNQRLKRMIANTIQEQAARKVENKRPRTFSHPRKTLLAMLFGPTSQLR